MRAHEAGERIQAAALEQRVAQRHRRVRPSLPFGFPVRWQDAKLQANALVSFKVAAGGPVTDARMERRSRLIMPAFDFHDQRLVWRGS